MKVKIQEHQEVETPLLSQAVEIAITLDVMIQVIIAT